MRIAIALMTISAGMVFAQRQASPCQAEETAVQRFKVLLQDKAVPPPQVDEAQAVLAHCQARQAKLAEVKAETMATQAKLEELRKRYNDSHPDVAAVRAKLDELRAQEIGLSMGQGTWIQRSTYTPTSLKQASGGLQTGLPDRWWKNPATAQSLGLTADQQKKMDDVFQQYRLKLIDFNAALEKEEVTLEPLVAALPLDEAKITAQIDRVAQARAELEKANGRMLLGIRKLLTPEQWSKLQTR